jgi:hypothetical protein
MNKSLVVMNIVILVICLIVLSLVLIYHLQDAIIGKILIVVSVSFGINPFIKMIGWLFGHSHHH